MRMNVAEKSMNTFVYASSKDINNVREYLVALTEKEIEDYCTGKHKRQPDLFHPEKEIVAWYNNPTPIMVAHHFTWVGKGKRPPMLNISRPFTVSAPFFFPHCRKRVSKGE